MKKIILLLGIVAFVTLSCEKKGEDNNLSEDSPAEYTPKPSEPEPTRPTDKMVPIDSTNGYIGFHYPDLKLLSDSCRLVCPADIKSERISGDEMTIQ